MLRLLLLAADAAGLGVRVFQKLMAGLASRSIAQDFIVCKVMTRQSGSQANFFAEDCRRKQVKSFLEYNNNLDGDLYDDCTVDRNFSIGQPVRELIQQFWLSLPWTC